MSPIVMLTLAVGLASAASFERDPVIPLSGPQDPIIPISYLKPLRVPEKDLPKNLPPNPIAPIIIEGNKSHVHLDLDTEDPDSKVVGGTAAVKNEFPYQLRLLIYTTEGTYQCGASILNSKWALSAAHCFSGFQVTKVLVQAGYLNFDVTTGGEYDLYSDKITVHPNWNPNTNNNDLALLRVSGTFQTTSVSSKSIKLVPQGARPTGNAVGTGWGATSEGGSTSNTLLKVTLPVLADSICQAASAYGSSFNPNTMLCAGYTTGGRDTCQGDSGGPLVLNGVQIGVVSFGAGCAQPGYPGVYTRVASFNNWITQNAV